MRRYAWTIVAIAAFLVLFFGGTAVTLYTDWLWFKDLGFSVIFSRTFFTKLAIGFIFGLAFFAIVYANLWLARYIAPPPTMHYGLDDRLSDRFGRMARGALGLMLFAGTLIVSLMVGLEATAHWDEYLQYRNSIPFGTADPIFNKDVAFYVFQLPFIRYIYGWLFFTLLAATIAAAGLHYAEEKIEFVLNVPQFAPRVKAHLSILVALLFFLKAWGYYLDRYNLVTNPGGLFYGAGYTDIHARLPMLMVLMVVAIIAGLLVLLNIQRRGINLAIAAFVLLIGASFIFGALYPSVVQQFIVRPNEQKRELPYIKNAIENTRRSYKIDRVDERSYQVSGSLTPEGITKNQGTIQNVRLWDYRPLQAAYSQLQEIQQYYAFRDVDVDRYTINGRFRQVMLSARELDADQLNPNAQTWVNRRLVYTHGFGFVMSPVSEVTERGLPRFYVRDIPPDSTVDLEIRRPEVYFGEITNDPVFVDTATREFDYPSGDESVTTVYKGRGGVPVGSFTRRVLFALRFSDINMLLNQDFRPSSRVLFNRNIRQRARTLFPFLSLDGDPYLVVSNGRMYWFQDAYTTTNKYPYADMQNYNFDGMSRSLNYIRNSVKLVTDAYSGDVRAYMSDESDPMIRVYSKIFPGVFKPMSDMSPALRAHIRYPEDLFGIQADVLNAYHMTDPEVFYKKSDLWTIPDVPVSVGTTDTDAGETGNRMEPYYLIMRVPGEDREEMIILTPFIRAGKDNMVAWLCAKNDPEDFGKLILFEFPKGQLVYGPAQIVARINQDPRISQLLTLWNQQGSQVLRGNLVAIPIEGTILYVQPLYLQATGARIPELTRVIAAVGDDIAMEETFTGALSRVVGAAPGALGAPPETERPRPAPGAQPPRPEAPRPQPVGAPSSQEVQRLIQQANEQFADAQQSLREGNWAEYGKSMDELRGTLRRLQESSQAPEQR